MVECGEGVVYLTSPGFQLILAYSWARPAILVAGKGRWGMFFIMPPPFSMGGGECSITSLRKYVCPVLPVQSNTNGFRAISFERNGVLD